MNYTKGEWKVVTARGEPWEDYRIIKSDTKTVATLSVYGTGASATKLEVEANANLIAAAPDMYEALKAWDKYLDTGPPQNLTFKEKAWHLTEQALAKAEGREE